MKKRLRNPSRFSIPFFALVCLIGPGCKSSTTTPNTTEESATKETPKTDTADSSPEAMAKRIVGEWVIAPEAVADTPSIQAKPEAERKAIIDILTRMAPTTSFRFTGKALIMEAGNTKRETPYTVGDIKDGELILKTTSPTGAIEDNRVTLENDHLTLLSKNMEFVLKRKILEPKKEENQ